MACDNKSLFLLLLNLRKELSLGLSDLSLPGDKTNLGRIPPLLGGGGGGLGLGRWVLADGGVALLVHVLHAVSSDSVLDVPGELLLVSILVLLDEVAHVVSHVASKDVSTVDISVQLLGLSIIAGEPLLRVGNVKTTVNGSLHGSKHLGSSRSPGQTNIKTGTESSGAIVVVLNSIHGTINVGVSLVDGVQLELLEDPPCEEKPGAVGGSVVGQANLHAVPGQLMAVGSADDNITLQPGVSDLAGHVSVGAPHNHPVLGCIVFILVLDDQPLAGEVVGLALPPPPELDLEPLEVSLVFDDLDERHLDFFKTSLVEVNQAIKAVPGQVQEEEGGQDRLLRPQEARHPGQEQIQYTQVQDDCEELQH